MSWQEQALKLRQALGRAEYITSGMFKDYCKVTGKEYVPDDYRSRLQYISQAIVEFDEFVASNQGSDTKDLK